MKKMMGFFSLLMVLGVARGVMADTVHTGSGLIVAADLDSVTIILESGQRRALPLKDTTEAYDDSGQPILTVKLVQGDYVREEYMQLLDGRYVAKRLTLMRPAWRALESPEQ